MTRLNKFHFYLRTFNNNIDQMNVPSNEDVQHSLKDFPSDRILAWTDRIDDNSRCHICSYPCQMTYFDYISNRFPGGLFPYVLKVVLVDQRPFEREFFVRIQKYFPMMKHLTIENEKSQQKKFYEKVKEDNHQNMLTISYPNLKAIYLSRAHEDYIEQFLLDTETCLPNNVFLFVKHEQSQNVTFNFQRNETRMNCAKIIYFLSEQDFKLSENAEHYFAEIQRR